MHRLEKWKTKDRFPTFPPGARDDDDRPVCELKDQRKEVGRYAASSFSCPDFMLIFQLENASPRQGPSHHRGAGPKKARPPAAGSTWSAFGCFAQSGNGVTE
jgi:hypothetical protein